MSGYRRWWGSIALCMALGGCGGTQNPLPATPIPAEAQGDALLQAGDVQVRASVVQASALPPSVAHRYGIEPAPETLLLLVVANKGADANGKSVPVVVSTKVTDLRGAEQRVPMRQYHEGDAFDSIGTFRTTLPETLRFDLEVGLEGEPPVAMEFVREFYPQ
ncbi:MAG: DUF4426 domain-containing protein [Luteimonas sp.]